MISFPTTLNKGGHYFNQPKQSSSVKDSILSALTTTFTNTINSSISRMTSGRGFDTDGIRYNEDRDYNEQINILKRNFSSYSYIPYDNNVLAGIPARANDNSYSSQHMVESPFHVDSSVLNIVNNYYATVDKVLIETGNDQPHDKKGAEYDVNNYLATQSVAPSLFNPYNGVFKRGITQNVPLLSGSTSWENEYQDAADITNCSITELVNQSSKENGGVLGQARYRYIDFMYCKDLGKISNNHLITLRKFAHPIGDAIFETGIGSKSENGPVAGDIGHLVAWFNTDDNKLEDILNYEYQATWKELNSKIDQQTSQEDDESRGVIGDMLNIFSPRYNLGVAGGGSSASWNRFLGYFGIKSIGGTYANNDVALGRNYDNNKVYTPKNTVQDTHIYEGKLVFKQEFSLTFSYKLRAYSNINPKSAFLDLIGNIMEVTYHKGHFWSGKNQILGPQPHPTGWKKANQIIDSVSSGVGQFMDNLASGNFNAIKNQAASTGNQMIDKMKNSFAGKAAEQAASGDVTGAAKTLVSGLAEAASQLYQGLSSVGVGDAITGLFKNKLGRPALYAFDSLLPENNTGLWHVTIGNPKNPIMAFGNLILTDAKITHSGPLGLDDFPTELKVTVSLKHARSRDAVEIGKMYTKGQNNIYVSLASPYTKINYKNNVTISSGQYNTSIEEDNKGNTTLKANKVKTFNAPNISDKSGDSTRPYSLFAHFGCSAEQFAFNKDQLR
jgi:hypothetical protein